MSGKKNKPHVLLFPFPAQGHMPPMLDLAFLLSHVGGIHVTFLNTEYIHTRLSTKSHAFDRFARIPNFRFRTIPDGLPEDSSRPFLEFLDLADTMRSRSWEEYKKILLLQDQQVVEEEEEEGWPWPPITCVVADGFLPLALEVAEEVNIPVMILRTSSACSIWAYYCIPKLIESGEIPFSDEDDLDKQVQSVPGMEGLLRRRDLPSFIRQVKSTEARVLQFLMTSSANLNRAIVLITNTIDSLESPAISLLRSICPITYTLGPIHNLAKTVSSSSHNDNTKPQAASLWEEDHTCLNWLNSRPSKSVVYVSFGSITVMSREELLEFWHGLANSGYGFLWVVRPDLVQEGNAGMPPPELAEATKARGCIVSWAPQQEVLSHPAVGCFLTHSGWNSTLESIVAGLPMVCWPFLGDQQINSRYVSEVWKIGVDMKDKRGRGIVEKMVREVMDGEGAEELRKRAREMAEMAKQSIQENGSSYQDLNKLIRHIKSLNAPKE